MYTLQVLKPEKPEEGAGLKDSRIRGSSNKICRGWQVVIHLRLLSTCLQASALLANNRVAWTTVLFKRKAPEDDLLGLRN